MIDSHIHLDFEQFDTERGELVARAEQAGISQFVVPGVKKKYWQRQLNLQQLFPNCHLAFGIHPYFLDDYDELDLSQLNELITSQRAVAVGECGIDGFVAKHQDNLALQQEVFIKQIEIANSHCLPLIVHHRKSHHLIQAAFKQVRPERGGFIHAFSGSASDARKYIDRGFKLGIGGGLTYPRADKTITTIKRLGLEHCVLETDAPDMPLSNTFYEQKPYRNVPENLVSVAKKLASIFEVDLEQVTEITTANVKEVLRIT